MRGEHHLATHRDYASDRQLESRLPTPTFRLLAENEKSPLAAFASLQLSAFGKSSIICPTRQLPKLGLPTCLPQPQRPSHSYTSPNRSIPGSKKAPLHSISVQV